MDDHNTTAVGTTWFVNEVNRLNAERDKALAEIDLLKKENRGLHASNNSLALALSSCRSTRLALEAENESLAAQLQQLKRQLRFPTSNPGNILPVAPAPDEAKT